MSVAPVRRLAMIFVAALCSASVTALALLGVATAAQAASATASCPNSAFHGFSASLPDCRGFELVSSPDEGEPYIGATAGGTGLLHFGAYPTSLAIRAAAGGQALAFVGEPSSTSGDGVEDHPSVGNSWLATRSAAGWTAADITPNENNFSPFQSFSANDETGFYVETGRKRPMASTVEDGCNALYTRSSASGAFTPLFTSGVEPGNCGRPLFAGATRDMSQVAFQTEAALTPGSEEVTGEDIPENRGGHDSLNTEECTTGCNLYVEDEGRVLPVNVLEGKAAPGASFGGYPEESETEEPDFTNIISSDGARIFWTDTHPGTHFGQIYAFENDSTNVQVSGAAPAQYWAATPSGRYAFYTEDGALWRFDSHSNTSERLIEAGAEVQGVIGVNSVGAGGSEAEEEGSYLYVVANGVLTHEPNAEGEEATPGKCPERAEWQVEFGEARCNLYLLHGGAVTFIARLAGSDDYVLSANGGFSDYGGDWVSDMGLRLAELSPDGQNLVFESYEHLTGAPSNSEVSREEPQVFIFAADTNKLDCVSCSPIGEPAPENYIEAGAQAKLTVSATVGTYMHRWVSSNGSRVFFDSSQALVPQATDGVANVYEWERPASDGEPNNTCTAREASPDTGGCTYLLSGGTSEYDSWLLDADETGENVFFEHVGSLGDVQAPAGHNEVYDARVDGGAPEVSLSCTGTGCQGVPAAPPVFAAPASLTYSGLGNFAGQKSPASKKATQKKKKTRAQKTRRARKHKRSKGRHKRKRKVTSRPVASNGRNH